MKKTLLAASSIFMLAGCVDQTQADAKMITGCRAAVETMIAPRTVKEIKTTGAKDEKTMGSVYRRVEVSYIENDDFAQSEKQGSCLFSQQWGMFKSSHAALLEQVVFNDTVIGKKDGVIQGSMNDFMKLTEKVDAAMAQ